MMPTGGRRAGQTVAVGDYTVVLAALAGAVAGMFLLRMANARDARDARAADDRPPPPITPPTSTRYARRSVHTASPILLAVGLALFGVGLALGTGDGAWDVRPLIPGLVVLLAALVAGLRRGGGGGQPQAPAPDDGGMARDSGGAPAVADMEPTAPDSDRPRE